MSAYTDNMRPGALSAYDEAAVEAAECLMRYLEAADEATGHELIEAVHRLEALSLVLSAPSQQDRARALERLASRQ